MDDTSSLPGGQRGFLKILEFLMNMDEQRQRILLSRAVG